MGLSRRPRAGVVVSSLVFVGFCVCVVAVSDRCLASTMGCRTLMQQQQQAVAGELELEQQLDRSITCSGVFHHCTVVWRRCGRQQQPQHRLDQ